MRLVRLGERGCDPPLELADCLLLKVRPLRLAPGVKARPVPGGLEVPSSNLGAPTIRKPCKRRASVVSAAALSVGFAQRFLVLPLPLHTIRLERAIRCELAAFDAVREWDGGT